MRVITRITKSRWCAAAACLALLAGCHDGRHPPPEGTVTVDGRPLQEGYITFRPQAETPGPTAGGRIRDGRFAIPREGGLLAGKFRVEITATRRTGKSTVNHITGESVPASEQYLPARYNARSELVADVSADGPNRFAFELREDQRQREEHRFEQQGNIR